MTDLLLGGEPEIPRESVQGRGSGTALRCVIRGENEAEFILLIFTEEDTARNKKKLLLVQKKDSKTIPKQEKTCFDALSLQVFKSQAGGNIDAGRCLEKRNGFML